MHTPPLSMWPTKVTYLSQLMNFHWYTIITQSSIASISLTLNFFYSLLVILITRLNEVPRVETDKKKKASFIINTSVAESGIVYKEL